MFDRLKVRARECLDPHCAAADCGKPIGDGLRLPVRLSDTAAAVGRALGLGGAS